MGLVLALLAGYGTLLAYTAMTFGWRGVGLAPAAGLGRSHRHRLRERMAEAGLADVPTRQLVATVAGLGLLGALGAWVLFGGALPALVAATLAASLPLASFRHRRTARRRAALEGWPRLIEEVRVLTASAGRSIPQALFEVGERGPVELRSAFRAARREWLLSTDLARALGVLKNQLADPTADATCETLLVAHELGGADLDRRLADLAEDRRADLHHRRDAVARQAGVRFARGFVVVVPLGMAAAGLSVGEGRAAYQTPGGQLAVCGGLALVAACWWWAGRIMRLPDEERVFR
jgi:tight adherence protein B